MYHRYLMTIALMLIGVMGCSVKEEAFEEETGQVIEQKENGQILGQDDEQSGPFKLIFEAAPFVSGDADFDTKTYVVPNGDYSNYDFKWAEKDTVGIYPDAGSQVYFTMAAGAGAGTAEFDGGAWSCKEGHEYRSYFPFVGDIYLDAEKIPVSFTGQKQVGNDNSDHFQKYDYMYTPAVTKGTDNLTFSYHHLVTAILPWVELPAGHYTGITISLNEPLFVAKGRYDLTAESPAIVGTAYSNTLDVELDITFSSPDILKVYIPLAPLNMSGKTLTITVTDEDNLSYVFTKNPSMAYVAGKIYRLRASDVTVSEPEPVPIPEAVDLGLSVKWASFNLGASAPEEYGDYYAWGEVEPYYSSQDPLTWKDGKSTGYGFDSYRWCIDNEYSFTKYNIDANYGNVDYKTVLEMADDAAHVKLGGNWRMPTDAEWTELIEQCTWEGTTQGGVYGIKGTGPNSNSIFLPAAGYRNSNFLSEVGSVGHYWSSSLDTVYPTGAWNVFCLGDSVIRSSNGRTDGYSVRPVSE